MKKILLLFVFAIGCSTYAHSQIKLGAGLETNFDNLGIKGQLLLPISEAIQIQGSGTVFLTSPVATMFNADIHYLLTTGGDSDNILAKAFAGLNYWSSGFDGDDSELGINIGTNLTFPINYNLDGFIEAKLSLISVANFHLAAGVYF